MQKCVRRTTGTLYTDGSFLTSKSESKLWTSIQFVVYLSLLRFCLIFSFLEILPVIPYFSFAIEQVIMKNLMYSDTCLAPTQFNYNENNIKKPAKVLCYTFSYLNCCSLRHQQNMSLITFKCFKTHLEDALALGEPRFWEQLGSSEEMVVVTLVVVTVRQHCLKKIITIVRHEVKCHYSCSGVSHIPDNCFVTRGNKC